MLPATFTVPSSGHLALLCTPPRGTCSRLISLRLHRLPGHACINSGSSSPYRTLPGSVRDLHGAVDQAHVVSPSLYDFFKNIRDRPSPEPQARDGLRIGMPTNPDPWMAADVAADVTADRAANDLLTRLPNPFRRALDALRQRDTRKMLIYLQQISHMRDYELQDAIAALPRPTFTEFLRSLDPLHVASVADIAGDSYINPGMYQALLLDSVIDDWGTRLLYSRLLRAMLRLLSALKAAGQVLLTEEYIYLLRCAGAATDPMGAKWIWNEMVRTQTTEWRQTELYAEYVAARFLTRPLYTGHDKTMRMVTPRSLHNSRFMLHWFQVRKLDYLRYHTRRKRLYFGLNKDNPNVAEDIIRIMRKKGAVLRFYNNLVTMGQQMNEPLLCAIMIAFGRSGLLRYIGTHILYNQFGIYMTRLTYDEGKHVSAEDPAKVNEILRAEYRVKPTLRTLEAVVETYGSNGEIATALQLADHISRVHQVPIPLYVWQDLLEWAHIMNSEAVAAAWKRAKMPSKIPKGAVELIWETMTSAPYQVEPGFSQYNTLIRDIIGRHRFSKILAPMRQAIKLYNAHCREYEQAVFEYVHMVRSGVHFSEIVHQYDRARFKKAKMRHDIRVWCRDFLKEVRSSNPANPLVTVYVPDFIDEFQDFVGNPAKYRTANGYVSLLEPTHQPLKISLVRRLPITIQIKLRLGEVLYKRTTARKLSILYDDTMAGHEPITRFNLATLITNTGRTTKFLGPSRPADEGWEDDSAGGVSGTIGELDDDDGLF